MSTVAAAVPEGTDLTLEESLGDLLYLSIPEGDRAAGLQRPAYSIFRRLEDAVVTQDMAGFIGSLVELGAWYKSATGLYSGNERSPVRRIPSHTGMFRYPSASQLPSPVGSPSRLSRSGSSGVLPFASTPQLMRSGSGILGGSPYPMRRSGSGSIASGSPLPSRYGSPVSSEHDGFPPERSALRYPELEYFVPFNPAFPRVAEYLGDVVALRDRVPGLSLSDLFNRLVLRQGQAQYAGFNSTLQKFIVFVAAILNKNLPSSKYFNLEPQIWPSYLMEGFGPLAILESSDIHKMFLASLLSGYQMLNFLLNESDLLSTTDGMFFLQAEVSNDVGLTGAYKGEIGIMTQSFYDFMRLMPQNPREADTDTEIDDPFYTHLDTTLTKVRQDFRQKKAKLEERREQMDEGDNKEVIDTKITALDESIEVVTNAKHSMQFTKFYPQARHPQIFYSIAKSVERDLKTTLAPIAKYSEERPWYEKVIETICDAYKWIKNLGNDNALKAGVYSTQTTCAESLAAVGTFKNDCRYAAGMVVDRRIQRWIAPASRI